MIVKLYCFRAIIRFLK